MEYLATALEQLKAELSVDWTGNFAPLVTKDDTSDQEYVANVQVQISTSLNPAVNLFYDALNFSVISGEYVKDIDSCKKILIEIENHIRNEVANVELSTFPQMSAMAQDFVETNFYRPVHDTLRNYQILLDFVEQHLVYKQNTRTILRLSKDEVQMGKDTDSSMRDMASLFKINVRLAQIDHTISFTQSYFTELLLCQDKLKSLTSTSSYLSILSKKCGYLLYKLSFRLQESQQNYLYAIDFNYSTVEPEEVSEFSMFNAVVKGHYDAGLKPQLYKQRLESAELKFEQKQPLTFDDYHALIKYLKDEVKDVAKLKELRKNYQAFYTKERESKHLFDKKAFDVAFCYLENNILSLELDQQEFNLKNWQEKLKAYIDRADTFKNKNFFPYYKIIKEFLRKEISDLFVNKDTELPLLKELIEKYEKYLTNLVKNVGICDETDYLAFQNDYDGCVVSINDGENISRKCFIASSYVLPLNYKEIKEDLEIYKAELNKFKSMYEIQELIDIDRKDIQTVKKEIEKNDKRHVEILSIFAALVMFVSNTIQIFSRTSNFNDAVAYTLFLAYSLGLFVLMIWFVTRPNGISFKKMTFAHWFTFGLFAAGFIAAVIYVFAPKNEHQKRLEYLEFKIDSLKKTNLIENLKTISIQQPKPLRDSSNYKPPIAKKNNVKE